MKKFAWMTDIHFDFIEYFMIERFLDQVLETAPDGVFITGDIGTAQQIETYLDTIEDTLNCPIYFVLGNHDFYGGSFASVRKRIERMANHSKKLTWMNTAGVVALSEQTGLIGHDGWADGRLGNADQSTVMLNDFFFIEELIGLSQEGRFGRLRMLGDQAAEAIKTTLIEGIKQYPNLIMLTHVPPFKEACWHEGHITDDEFLPHFTCKAVGDVLREIMINNPQKQCRVLCGHTHGAGQATILPNLDVLTKDAEYGEIRSPLIETLE